MRITLRKRITFAVLILASATAAVLATSYARRPFEVPPSWNGNRIVCPAGYYPYADENEVMEGKDGAHCVRN